MTSMGESVADATGTLRATKSGWIAQFSIGPKQRKAVLLRACPDEESAKVRKEAIAKLVAALRAADQRAMIPNVIRDGGTHGPDDFRKLEKLVARVVAGKEPGLSKLHAVRHAGTTVTELAKLWTSGELAEAYPDHVKVKSSSSGDRARLAWLEKVRMPDGSLFGARPMADVTLEDCDHVMRALPSTAQRPATRRHYAQSLRKLLVYSVYPLCLRPVMPIPEGWLPKAKNDRAKAWVYPSEDRALMRCGDVAVGHRLFFGFLAREGMRAGEALALAWTDLDLEHGVVRLDVNKTDEPRSWVMGPDVTRALTAWRDMRTAKAKRDPLVFPKLLLSRKADSLAKRLRTSLRASGATRPEVTSEERAPGRMRLRAHDLRGSFVTLALAAGRSESWVTDRTGHKSSTMLYRYKRASRTAAELGLGWFDPLDLAIPELAGKGGGGATGVQPGGAGGPQTSPAGSEVHETATRHSASDTESTASKSAVRKSVSVRVRPSVQRLQSDDPEDPSERANPPLVAPLVAPLPLGVLELEAAVARLTRALATADDDTIADLVLERRALRDEIRAMRETAADVVRLDDERQRRGR